MRNAQFPQSSASFTLRSDSPCLCKLGWITASTRADEGRRNEGWGGKKTGWPLNVASNSTFLWLRFAAALGMFKRSSLLYFPRAVVNAIPSSNIQLTFRFPRSLQGKVSMSRRPWFLLSWLGNDTASIHEVHSVCRTWAVHMSCVFQSFIMSERDNFENQGAQ